MKKLVSLLFVAAGTIPFAMGQQITFNADKTGGCDLAGGAEVDLNNDGYLDIIWGGTHADGGGRIIEDAQGNEVQAGEYNSWMKIYNPATRTYDMQELPQLLGERIFCNFADFNTDGNMDYLVVSSANGNDLTSKGIFIGDGKGGFTQQEISVKDADGNDFRFAPTAAAIADFNNDGLVDIVGIGYLNADNTRYLANAVLINQGDFNFVATSTDLIPYNFGLPTVMVTDLNNDGYIDILVCGNADNDINGDAIGTPRDSARAFEAYLNMGEEGLEKGIPSFYSLDLYSNTSFYQMGYGDIQCADFNNDGIMDVFVTGESPVDAQPQNNGGASQWAWVPQMLIGDGEGGFTKRAQTNLSLHLNPLNNSNNAFRAIDIDGDGNFDLCIPGWCERTPGGEAYGAQTGYIYLNTNGNGTMTQAIEVPAGSEANVFVLDNGTIGERHFATTGYTNNSKWGVGEGGRWFITITNPYAKPARPDAPTALDAKVSKDKVTLSWSPAASSKKNATYEYYIKNKATGKLFTTCSSHVGGDLDGVRKLIQGGNAYLNNTITLNSLPNGEYEWGVQTINASFEGSVFATGNFTVTEGVSGVEEFNVSDIVVRTLADGVEVSSDDEATVSVYALSGAQFAEKKFNGTAKVALPSGCYIVKVVAAGSTKVQKVIL